MSEHRERDLFELLIREHATSLRVLLRAALHGEDVLDELFQETLVRAWDGLERFDRSRDFGKWIRGNARNVLREHWRARSRAPVAEELIEAVELHCATFQARRQDTSGDELAALHGCLDELPPHFRAAVDGRYRDGLRGQSLAERLGITFENLKKRLQRARKQLFDCMQTRAVTEELQG